jgi:hypothetical protein
MLGIDIGDNSIRVVNLRRRGSGFVMQTPIEIPFAPEQASNPIALGEMLGDTLNRSGWRSQKAVITLPPRQCFVRYFPLDLLPENGVNRKGHLSKSAVGELLGMARQTVLLPPEQLVFDLWTGAEVLPEEKSEAVAGNGSTKGVLVAAAQKKAVEFCQELASVGGVKIQSIELRSLAAINGLLMHWHEAQETNIAVVYLERQSADVGILDPDGLVSLQSVTIAGSEQGWESIADELIGHLQRICNTIRLSHPECNPQHIFLATGDARTGAALSRIVEKIQQVLHREVTVCQTWEEVHPSGKESETDYMGFFPALGAAFDGLSASPTWFDFLNPRGIEKEKKHTITWRPFALIGVAILVLVGAFWFSLVQQKQQELDSLKEKYAQTQPSLRLTQDAQANWSLFRPYLPVQEEGARREYLVLLTEISNLFPNTEEAHVTKLLISEKTGASTSTEYNITLSGRCSEEAVLNDFMNRLVESKVFQQVEQLGPVRTDPERNIYYPVSFTVICNFGVIPKVVEDESQ